MIMMSKDMRDNEKMANNQDTGYSNIYKDLNSHVAVIIEDNKKMVNFLVMG